MSRKKNDSAHIFIVVLLIAVVCVAISFWFNLLAAVTFGFGFMMVIIISDVIKHIALPSAGWAFDTVNENAGSFFTLQYFILGCLLFLIFFVTVIISLGTATIYFEKLLLTSRNTAINNSIEVKSVETKLQWIKEQIESYGTNGKQGLIENANTLDNDANNARNQANNIRQAIADKQLQIDNWWLGRTRGIPHANIMDSNCNSKNNYKTLARQLCSELNGLKNKLGITTESSRIAEYERLARQYESQSIQLSKKIDEYDSLRAQEIATLNLLATTRKDFSGSKDNIVTSLLGDRDQVFFTLFGYQLTKIKVIALVPSIFIEAVGIIFLQMLFLKNKSASTRVQYQPSTPQPKLLTWFTQHFKKVDDQPINSAQPLLNGRVDGQPLNEYVPYPTPQPHPLNINIGVDVHGNDVVICLADLPHFLCGGLTGGGKSTFIKGFTAQLIKNTSPEELKIIAIDMKDGATFFKFNDDPHLARPVAISRDDVNEYLLWLSEERQRRQSILTKAGCEDISEYLQENGTLPFPYMVVILEEVKQAVQADKGNKLLIEDLHSLSRSAGMHFFDCTQYPKAEVLNTSITANCGGAICFVMRKTEQSIAVLGEKGAEKLTGKGHALFVSGKYTVELHTHNYTKDMICDIVEKSKARYGIAVYEEPIKKQHSTTQGKLYDLEKKSGLNDKQGLTNYNLVVNTFNDLHSRGVRPSVNSISNTLGLNKGTVSKQLSRARANGDLRSRLQEA